MCTSSQAHVERADHLAGLDGERFRSSTVPSFHRSSAAVMRHEKYWGWGGGSGPIGASPTRSEVDAEMRMQRLFARDTCSACEADCDASKVWEHQVVGHARRT
jgi:hypothetical protein